MLKYKVGDFIRVTTKGQIFDSIVLGIDPDHLFPYLILTPKGFTSGLDYSCLDSFTKSHANYLKGFYLILDKCQLLQHRTFVVNDSEISTRIETLDI